MLNQSVLYKKKKKQCVYDYLISSNKLVPINHKQKNN